MSVRSPATSPSPPNFSNIDRRLTLAFSGIIFLLMVSVLVASVWYLHGIMEREQDRLAKLTTEVLSNSVSRVSFSGKYHARLLLEETKAQQPDILYLRLVDADGVIFAHSDPTKNDQAVAPEEMAPLRAVLDGNPKLLVTRTLFENASIREISLAYRGGYDNSSVGVLQVGISENVREKDLRNGVFYISLLILVLLAIGIFITLRVSSHFGSPIRKVAVALERERSYLHTLIHTIPDMIWLKDPDGYYLACNPAFELFFGASESEIVGKRDHDFVDKELADFFCANDKAAIAAGQPTVNEEWITLASGGKRIRLETTKTPMYSKNGELMGVLGIGHDITEHRAIQDELTRHRAHLEDVVQERTAELIAARQNAEAAEAETKTALEHLQRAQTELIRAEKIAGLGALVAGVAHELNTPIGNALMASSMLSDRSNELQKAIEAGIKRSTFNDYILLVNEVSTIMMRNLERAAHIIASFKQISIDQASYQRRRFEMLEIVDEIALAMAPTLRRSSVELSIDVSDGLLCDSYPGPLGQILANLINNAVVHAFDSGMPGKILVHARARGDHVEIAVSDDGKGIPTEHIGRIYDPFFTTRLGQGGSGLGLNIVYNLVTGLLGGEISVVSKIGAGSTFRLLLPMTAPISEDNDADQVT